MRGIGKTALLRQFRDELPRRVGRLWGTCDALFTPRPFGPLLEPAAELGGEPQALVAGGGARPFDVAVAMVESLRSIAPAAKLDGPGAALAVLDGLELDDYRYYHSTRADLLRRLDRADEARAAYSRALELTQPGPEQRFLERRLAELSDV